MIRTDRPTLGHSFLQFLSMLECNDPKNQSLVVAFSLSRILASAASRESAISHHAHITTHDVHPCYATILERHESNHPRWVFWSHCIPPWIGTA